MTPLLITRAEAAEALSVSLRTFQRHFQPHLHLVRVGQLRLVVVEELNALVATLQDR